MVNPSFFLSERNKPVYILIRSFLDDKFIGVLYGEIGVGKTYFIEKLLEEEFIHYYTYVSATDIENIKEFLADLYLDDYTVLVIDDAQNLSLDDFREIFKYYLTNKTLNVIFVGNRNLKQKLNSFKFKSIRAGLNFILEFKPLQNFKEFVESVKHYTSENGISVHFTKGALKYIYKKTGGRIKDIVEILDKLKDKKLITSLYFEKKKIIVPLIGTVALISGMSYIIVSEANKITKILKEKEKKPQKKVVDTKTLEKIQKIKEKDKKLMQIAKINPALLEEKEEYTEGSNILIGECKAATIEKTEKEIKQNKQSKNIEKPKVVNKSLQELNKLQKDNSKISSLKKVYKYAIFLGVCRSEKSAKKVVELAYKITGEKPIIKTTKENLNKVIVLINDKKKLYKVLKALKKTKTFKDAYFRKGNFLI